MVLNLPFLKEWPSPLHPTNRKLVIRPGWGKVPANSSGVNYSKSCVAGWNYSPCAMIQFYFSHRARRWTHSCWGIHAQFAVETHSTCESVTEVHPSSVNPHYCPVNNWINLAGYSLVCPFFAWEPQQPVMKWAFSRISWPQESVEKCKANTECWVVLNRRCCLIHLKNNSTCHRCL